MGGGGGDYFAPGSVTSPSTVLVLETAHSAGSRVFSDSHSTGSYCHKHPRYSEPSSVSAFDWIESNWIRQRDAYTVNCGVETLSFKPVRGLGMLVTCPPRDNSCSPRVCGCICQLGPDPDVDVTSWHCSVWAISHS